MRYLSLVAQQYHIKGSAEWNACESRVSTHVPYPVQFGKPPSSNWEPSIPADLTVMWFKARSRAKNSLEGMLKLCQDQAVDGIPIYSVVRAMNDLYSLPSDYKAFVITMDQLEHRLRQADQLDGLDPESLYLLNILKAPRQQERRLDCRSLDYRQ
jgi:hypothetical protein